jgi:putative peptidoglycan lipid II flippase
LAGWGRFVLQVLLACAVLAAWLMWAAQHWDWVGLHSAPILRVGLMVGVLCVSGVLYFVALWLTGLKLRELLRQ